MDYSSTKKKFDRLETFLLMCSFLVVTACSNKPKVIHKSVYYWKVNFNLSKNQIDSLKALGIRKVYTRFFDVNYKDESQSAIPIAPVTFQTRPDSQTEIIPVIFLRNKVFLKIRDKDIEALSGNICHYTREIADANGIHLSEIQFDCDWNQQTRGKFFSLISACKEKLAGVKTSCTIRLHQLRYENTGVPPCERAMLMFYNMGDLSKLTTTNSIYDSTTAQAYLANFRHYPLPLDVALPLFDLAVIYRDGKPINSIAPEVIPNPIFHDIENGIYVVQKDTFINLIEIKRGDKIKVDEAGLSECLRAANQLNRYIREENLSVCIFDVQPDTFFNYDTSAIQKIYSAFR